MRRLVLRDVVTRMALDPGYFTAFQMDFRGRAIAAGLDGDEQRVVRALVRPVSELALMRARQSALHAELLEPALLERVHRRLGVDLAARGIAGRPATTSGAAPPVNRDLGRGARAAGLGAVVGGLRAAGTALTTVAAAIQKAGDAIGGAAGAAVTQAGKDIEKVGEGLGRLAGNLGSLDAPGAIEAAGQTLAAAVNLVGNALEAIGKAADSPALIAAGKAVQDFANHVEAYAAGAAAVVSILADAATGAVVDAIGVAAGAVAEAGRAIGEAIGAAAGAIADGLAALWDLAVEFVGSLFGSAPSTGAPAAAPPTTGTSPTSPPPPGDPDEPDEPDDPDDPGDPDDPTGPGDAGFAGDDGNEGTGGGRPRFGPLGGRGSGVPAFGGRGDVLAGLLGRLGVGAPPSGPGSGVIDPLETALGRIAVDLSRTAARERARTPADDGTGGGGGRDEPGTGRRGAGLHIGRIRGADLRRFVPHFDRDPLPDAARAALRSAGRSRAPS